MTACGRIGFRESSERKHKEMELTEHVQPRAVDTMQGWRWIVAGFRLFARSPLIWIVFFIIYMVLELALALFIPVIGAIGAAFLDPLLIAGFMAGCRALELGEEMELPHLFAAFSANWRQFTALGGVYLGGKMLIVIFAMVVGNVLFGPLPELDFAKLDPADPALQSALAHYMVIALLVLALLVPLLMAYWFAPALLLFDGLSAVPAMKLSFAACVRNIMPFTVYGVVGMALFVVGSIPLGLGLLAAIPVLFATSLYASYRDIFVVETVHEAE